MLWAGVVAQDCPPPVLDEPHMTTLSVGTTVFINGSSPESPVQCFWNGSNDTVHVVLNSTAVNFTVTVTALGEGSGELNCNSTCTGSDVDNTTNSIFFNVTGEYAPG